MESEKTPEDTSATRSEVEVAFGPPAPVSNRILLTMMPLGGRLSFLETGPDGKPHFRAAVFLGVDTLISLQDLIGRMVQPSQPPEEAADVSKG